MSGILSNCSNPFFLEVSSERFPQIVQLLLHLRAGLLLCLTCVSTLIELIELILRLVRCTGSGLLLILSYMYLPNMEQSTIRNRYQSGNCLLSP